MEELVKVKAIFIKNKYERLRDERCFSEASECLSDFNHELEEDEDLGDSFKEKMHGLMHKEKLKDKKLNLVVDKVIECAEYAPELEELNFYNPKIEAVQLKSKKSKF